MTKEESLEILNAAGVDISLTKQGEIRSDVLALAAQGVQAKANAEAYEETIATLNEQLEAADKKAAVAVDSDIIPYGDDSYRLVTPKSYFGSKVVTAATLKEDSEMLEQLLELKSPILEKVEGGES